MSGPDDSEFDRRIVFKIPEYMPELRDELLKYPPNQRSKRMLQLASLGLMSTIVAKPGGQAEGQQVGKKIEKPARSGGVQPKPEQHLQQEDVQQAQPVTGEPTTLPEVLTPAVPVAPPADEAHPLQNGRNQELDTHPADVVDSQAIKESELAPVGAPGGRRNKGPNWPTSMHS